MDWQTDPTWPMWAECQGADPSVFFGPDDKLPMSRDQVETAREFCHRCPVQADCLVESFQSDERFGIWGGLTFEERKRTREQTRSMNDALDLLRNGELYGLVVKL